ncbi:MAG TPA: cell division protein ZipA C-terminal FtsZ-binding domain-containing protein [Vicinamibacterales bacterium]
MAALRWILLGAGIALILGLWWWEARKAKLPVAEGPTADDPADLAEEAELAGAEFTSPDDAPDASRYFGRTSDRQPVPRRPPLIEIPEDLEVDVSDFVGIERYRQEEPDFVLEAEPSAEQDFAGAAFEETETPAEVVDDHHRAPWIRTQPLARDEVAPRPEGEAETDPATDPIERRTAEASRQRIVALRLIAAGEFWAGAELRSALEAEGLHFGSYSIFHREREDGKSLVYVASMMEPGSFDIDRMDEVAFPGISLFGVVPGPLDAPATFDLVLTVGRALAERLRGQLQDEQGSTLTAQRILNLREELVHFEHRNRRLRRP